LENEKRSFTLHRSFAAQTSYFLGQPFSIWNGKGVPESQEASKNPLVNGRQWL